MQLPPSTSALPAEVLVAVKIEVVPEFDPPTWVVTPPLVCTVGLPAT